MECLDLYELDLGQVDASLYYYVLMLASINRNLRHDPASSPPGLRLITLSPQLGQLGQD